ncbi:Amastin surface glycoprotein [Novymonas esmeraldas]|uniref:Amastin surface glycoprotein n=1 Tax=Novymonas esmeraldas TaxID=1808958 RepID=A0AAW0ES38_9TRYP
MCSLVGNVFLAIACLVLEAIVFILTVVGTPIDVFRSRAPAFAGVRACYSMWGSKRCGNYRANSPKSTFKGFPSSGIEKTMNAASAFAIISIFLTLVAMVLTVLLVCKCIFRVIPGIFSVLAFVTLLVCWACMAGAYNKSYGPGLRIKRGYSYTGGFGLIVAAWCLQTVEMILVFFA